MRRSSLSGGTQSGWLACSRNGRSMNAFRSPPPVTGRTSTLTAGDSHMPPSSAPSTTPDVFAKVRGHERAAILAGARDALEQYGTGLTGSRLLNGTIPLHLELEQEIAQWMGTEDAIVFTTGHQANLGTLGTILAPGDTVVADSGDHASILDGCILSRAKLRPFRHNRIDRLE